MERNDLNLLKHMCKISISNIILNGKILSYFSCSQKEDKSLSFTLASKNIVVLGINLTEVFTISTWKLKNYWKQKLQANIINWEIQYCCPLSLYLSTAWSEEKKKTSLKKLKDYFYNLSENVKLSRRAKTIMNKNRL